MKAVLGLAGLAFFCLLPLVGLGTLDNAGGVTLIYRPEWLIWAAVGLAAVSMVAAVPRWFAWPAGKTVLLPGPEAEGRIVLVMLAFFAAGPLFLSRSGIDMATVVLLYTALGMGLSIVITRAGLLDLGYAAFYALGAYMAALISTRYGLSFWLCVPLSGLTAAAVAALVGVPLLRLRGDYLAIGTVGFAEIVQTGLKNWASLTGGPNGISGIPRPDLFGLDFAPVAAPGRVPFHSFWGIAYQPEYRLWWLYALALALCAGVYLLTRCLSRSALGRAFEAVKEDEIAAVSLGLPVIRLKIAAYALSAFVGGIMGCFFAAKQGFVSPESFGFMESVLVLSIVVLGGGRVLGTLLAAGVLVILPELARDFEAYRMVFFGAVLVGVMLLRPHGFSSQRVPSVQAGEKV